MHERISSLPRIKGKLLPEESEATGNFSTGGLSSLVGALSDAVDRAGYAPNQQVVVLRNKLGLGREAFERERHVLGRWINKITMSEPYYIDVSGALLMQIHARAFGDYPKGISVRETYLLRRDLAQDILGLLENDMSRQENDAKTKTC